jgi:hypothetical protein
MAPILSLNVFYKVRSYLLQSAQRRLRCIVCRGALLCGKPALLDRGYRVDVTIFCRKAVAPAPGHAWVAIG